MTVTKQTYTANATWTAVQLADMFRSAFIDAGLMADWYDSFLGSTYENRILRIHYIGTNLAHRLSKHMIKTRILQNDSH